LGLVLNTATAQFSSGTGGDLIIEGIRPGRVVRIRPESWPKTQIPREEYDNSNLDERFPTPAIFPKY
jgi:hypothetical protein